MNFKVGQTMLKLCTIVFAVCRIGRSMPVLPLLSSLSLTINIFYEWFKQYSVQFKICILDIIYPWTSGWF
jgi:hypothetical protein